MPIINRPDLPCARCKAADREISSYCRDCQRLNTKEAFDRKGGSRDYHLRQRYGITEADYDRMYEFQGGLCKSCREDEASHVDHCHRCGAVRGILCFTCNVGIGNFKDDVDRLRKAVAYLELEHEPKVDTGKWNTYQAEWSK